jgi:hypothetical protein
MSMRATKENRETKKACAPVRRGSERNEKGASETDNRDQQSENAPGKEKVRWS